MSPHSGLVCVKMSVQLLGSIRLAVLPADMGYFIYTYRPMMSSGQESGEHDWVS